MTKILRPSIARDQARLWSRWRGRAFLAIGLMLFTGGGTAAAGPAGKVKLPCEAAGGPERICGFRSPEDIADLRGSTWILISEQDALPGASGLAALNVKTGLLIRYSEADIVAGAAGLGEPGCAPAESYHAGGIGVRPEGDGYRVVMINHGAEDRVEILFLSLKSGKPALSWRGCVKAPSPLFLNDIAPLQGGGFAATHMYDRAKATDHAAQTERYLRGEPTGYVVRWSPEAGWREVPDSEGSFPNGLDVAVDGSALYYAETYGHAVTAISLNGGSRRRISVAMQPDNVTVAPDGAIIVAGGVGDPVVSTQDCAKLRPEGCGFPSEILRLDFQTDHQTRLFADTGETTPGASVAVLKDNWLYIGTSFGDRITIAPAPTSRRSP